jgi:hypothetical protein
MRSSASLAISLLLAPSVWPEIRFSYRPIACTLETSETEGPARYTPATMAGGVAVFDYDGDGDLDIFFTNGAEIPGLKKTAPKYWNRLFENDGSARFTDVTKKAGLAGTGYDTGVAAGDYDADGDMDLFLAGVHRNSLYRNNGDRTFTDVTSPAGLARPDEKYGPLWAVAGAWLDYNRDGRLDLFVVNYLSWDVSKEKPCPGYCHPQVYDGLPNSLYRNNGDGTFADASETSGIRAHVGKGMGAAVADFDRNGFPDIFVTNDKLPNFLFRNLGNGPFEEIALRAGVALADHALEVSGMGCDFRDFDNDGLPDIIFVALDRETFPLFRNTGKGAFIDITNRTGLAHLSSRMAGYGPAMVDFDNDGWKDIFVSRGHVQSLDMADKWQIEQHNTVFRNLGNGKLAALTDEAGLASQPPRRHRGAAFGDLNGDGRIDAVVTALRAPAEIWINESPGKNHWLMLDLNAPGAEVRIVTPKGAQYNHVSPAVGYASSSAGPVHFGVGGAARVESIEIRWPSGEVQKLGPLEADQVLTLRPPTGNR